MQITASLVNELRQKTGVGMMQCKKALTETDGDMDKAVELLRKQGAASASRVLLLPPSALTRPLRKAASTSSKPPTRPLLSNSLAKLNRFPTTTTSSLSPTWL